MKAPSIVATRTALPLHAVSQEELLARLLRQWSGRKVSPERVEQFHRATGVKTRHLALPMEDYPALDSFPKKNRAWIEAGFALGCEAVRGALERAGFAAVDVDEIFFTTVTGIAVPSLCARIAARLGFRPDVKRTPLFGLGCVGGAAAVARAADYLRGFPGHVAVVLSIELCSLTLQLDDFSVANMIATGLFGDGAAAVVLAGADRAPEGAPRVTASRSVLYPDTEEVMGWEIVEGGFQVVLTGRVPEVARENLGRDVESLLADLGVPRSSIAHFVVHTGGPKVLEAVEESLSLPRSALARSWRSLETVGNLSSASVLFVLDDLLRSGEPRAGERGLMTAMGPGFVSELVVLEW